MALSVFDDKAHRPAPREVSRVLGPAAAPWRRLVTHVARTHAPITEQWNFAGPKFGWSLRLVREDRVVLYLTPQTGSFLAGVVVGEKAAASARARGLSADALALLEQAPRYAEGRGIRVGIVAGGDLTAILELVALKMEPAPRGSAPRRARGRSKEA